MRRRRPLMLALVAGLALLATLPAAAGAASDANRVPRLGKLRVSYPAPKLPPLPAGHQRIKLRYGPITVHPGTNIILNNDKPVPTPKLDGYITRMQPNMTFRDGTVPRTDIMHLHHAVMLNANAHEGDQRFLAAGEEKTIFTAPDGFGFPYRRGDRWVLNYMVHNYTAQRFKVYMDFTLDFIPASSTLSARTKPLYTIWNDVENGKAYPVFDVFRNRRRPRFTYPNDRKNAYAGRQPPNVWTAPRDTTLVWTAGHLHPGGLWTDLEVVRRGTTVVTRPGGPVRGSTPDSVRIFRSVARYYDPNGPISWDMGMTATPKTWRVRLRRGDQLRVSATYEDRHADWFESMGIMLAFASDDAPGVDPFASPVALSGKPVHGAYAENRNYGGGALRGIPDPRRLPDGRAPGNTVPILGYRYRFGGWGEIGARLRPPTVRRGQSLRFVNRDGTTNPFSLVQVPHTVTGCKLPCTKSTGISYPLASGGGFDSAQLAYGPGGFTAASNTLTWDTPATLPDGTYTYYCRMHPFMRGWFRVKG